MNRLFPVLIWSCQAVALLPLHAEKFYVAVDGKDGAISSKARPLKTVQAAVDAALRANKAPVHTIYIGPGSYTLSQPIIVQAGQSKSPLVLCAADPAQPPILDGSGLPPAADPQKSNEALLTVKGGAVSLEHVNISHSPAHAIWIEKANPFRVSQCSLSDIHGHAIRISGAEQGVVEGCRIDGVDGTGIWATGGERTTLTASKAIIKDNEISGVNRWKGGGGLGNGIYAEGVGITVEQNTIIDSIEQPWTMGIRVSGNDCLVEKNRLHHVSYGDAGALYVGGRDLARRGNVVRFNLVEDCANGIYLDDRASGNNVTGNVILRAKAAIFIGGGQGNTVTKNVVSGSGAFLKMDNRGMSWAKLQHPFKEDYARLQTFLGGPGVKARLFKAYPALTEITEQNALLPFHNIVTDNYAEADSTAIEYTDMDHILGGQHKGEYEKWNTIAAPRTVNLPKEQPIDLTALGAPGVTSNMLGAHVSSITRPK